MAEIMKLPKRLITQFAFFLAQNPLLNQFISGKIYTGPLKNVCTPGLNCYSCPAALYSCPIGSMQLFFAGAKQSLSLFVAGFLITTAAAFGRFICGYVCPMGLLQDLVYKIKTPKLRVRMKYLSYLKYVILAVFVIGLPLLVRHDLTGLGAPWFCKYICPSGTIFGAVPLISVNDFLRKLIGVLFNWKVALASILVISSLFVNRFFCRVLCPLGAIYSLFNRFSFFRINFQEEKCVSCDKCSKACHICLEPVKQPNAPECVRCGNCVRSCPTKALAYGTALGSKKD